MTHSEPDPPSPARSPAAEVVTLRVPRPPDGTPTDSAGDVAEALRALLTVAGALARYRIDVRTRAPLAAARRARQDLHRGARIAVGQGARTLMSAGHVVTAVVGGLADVLLPTLVREALSRVDVTALVLEFVDLDRLAGALDVDAVVARVDLDAAVARVDLDAVVGRVDVGAIAGGLDLDSLVDKVDLDRAVDRVDIDRVLARVDLDDVVARVDLDRAVDGVDLDRVIARADVVALARWVVQEIDLAALIRSSSGSVASELARGVREQSADADRAVDRVVDRLLHRHGRRTAIDQPSAAGDTVPEASS